MSAAQPTLGVDGAVAVPEPDDVIDYDAVYASYLAALVDKLRGLSTSLDYFDLWVPDEEPLTSLRNLLDSAANLGRSSVRLYLGPASAPRLDALRLLSMAQRFGVATLAPVTGGLLLSVKQLQVPEERPAFASPEPGPARAVSVREPLTDAAAPSSSSAALNVSPKSSGIPPAYSAELTRAAAELDHLADGDDRSDAASAVVVGSVVVTVRASLDVAEPGENEAVLRLLIDETSHEVRRARFAGGVGLTQGLLNELCRVLEGLPILEAREHGVVRLEHQLRSRGVAAPVPGIVSPDAAGSLFELPTLLVRRAFEQYQERGGYQPGPNRYNPQPNPRWLVLDEAARRAWLAEVSTQFALDFGSELASVTIAEIRDNVRIILGLPRTWSSAEKQRRLMQLEDAIKTRIDTRLEVFAEELKDQNKKRRLAVVTEPSLRASATSSNTNAIQSASKEKSQ